MPTPAPETRLQQWIMESLKLIANNHVRPRDAVSSARLYWESKLAFFAPKGVALPVAVSAFPDEIYTAPRSWTEKAYPTLIHYNRLPKGGHFAAWEQPQAFTEELRASFRSLR
jgi:pimeloyl-ACP methyl ester carboxylesterase